jgi:probable HAF family extracellular repeat protein
MKRFVVLAVALSACASFANAQFKFKYCSIDYPAGYGTVTRGINERGQIAGSYADQYGNLHAMLIQNDTFIPLAPTTVLGTEYSDAFKVNDRGDVVGEVCDSVACHGFLLRNGVLTILDYPGAADTVAWGINNSGEIVGWWDVYDSSGNLYEHGFRWKDGNFSELTFPGSGDTYAIGNNDLDVVVGGWDSGPTTTSEQGYAYWRGWWFSIEAPFPDVAYTQPNDINDFGLIVGEEYTPAEWEAYLGHGFLAFGRQYIQLNFPDAAGTTAWGINSFGEMVGNWFDSNGGTHGWVVRRREETCPSFQVQDSSQLSSPQVLDSSQLSSTPVKPAAGRISVPGRLGMMRR